jgi:hypothetical protein
MAMNTEDMKNAIKDKMFGEKDAASANKKFGDAVLEYLCDNITVVMAWSAKNPSSGVSDPTASFTCTVSGNGTLTPSPSFAAMLVKLATLIKGLTISPPAGFSLTPIRFNPAGVLTVIMANEDNFEDAMLHFCSQTISSIISSFPNPSPFSGSHSAFVGATTGMNIS